MLVLLGIDLFSYLVTCGVCIAVWVLTTGSSHQLQLVANDPTRSLELEFWPVWVILGWGALFLFHLGVVISIGLFGRRAQRRRQRMARQAARAAARLSQQAAAAARPAARRAAAAVRRQPSVTQPPTPARAAPERKWVSVMFTDIANSTRLTEDLGDDEWSRVLAAHRHLVRNLVLARGGEVVGTQGDGFLARFPTPAEAVLCGVDIQREMRQTSGSTGLPLQVRIGVHAGEAVEEDGDLVGRVINVAARVTAETAPGEILVTEPVADYVGGQLRLEDRGLRELRGLAQPRHVLAVRWEGEETR